MILSASNKSRLRLLISELKSKKYKQCKKRLHEARTEMYCWGGVAIDIYFKETGQGYWKDYDNSTYSRAVFTETAEEATIYIPDLVLRWYGLEKIDAISFIDANETGSTFEAIANVIQSNILKEKTSTPSKRKRKRNK